MSLSVKTKNDLKNLPATARIRFVEEDICLFWQDLTSDIQPDEVNTILSNIGTRWRKIRSASSQGEFIIWENTPGTFTAVGGRGYIKAPAGGDEMIILPTNPPIGTPVGILKGNETNYGTNRVLINRNGQLINGLPFDRQVVFAGQRVILQFLGGAVGWKIESDYDVFLYSGSILSFAAPSSLDSPQRGIIDFAGKNFNTSGVWSNPFTSGNVRVSRYADATSSNPSFLFDQVLSGNSNSLAFTTFNESFSGAQASTAGFDKGFIHIGFRSASGRISQIRLNSIYIHNYVVTVGSFRNLPAWIDVYGSNDAKITTKLNYGGTQNTGERRFNLISVFKSIETKLLASVSLSTQAEWPTTSSNGPYKHRYINIASSEYYSDFFLVSTRGDVAAGFATSEPPFTTVNEIEMYGDIQTVFVP